VIAAISAHGAQLPLFYNPPGENGKRKKAVVVQQARCKTPRDIHLSLFDKHDDSRAIAEEENRINELMDLPEYALTKRELAQLDEIVAERCREIQEGWSPRVEASRRGFGYQSSAHTFTDSHGRALPRVEVSVVAPSDEESEDLDE